MRTLGAARIAYMSLVLLGVAAIFATHSRWIFAHFSSDGYLEDSGWLAYLFQSADPLLHNPSGINDLSYYAHHLSPHIFLVGAPLSRLLGFTGIQILAYHQGFFFGLFFLAFCLLAAQSDVRRRDWVAAAAAAVVLGAVSNALLQAASYPHFEIAIVSLASLGIAARLAGYHRVFVLCLIWLPLVREDGGFYAAVVCLACAAVEHQRGRRLEPSTRLLITLAGAGVAASALSFLIKAWLFPGFNAFSSNFSGHRWDHVTAAFVGERVRAMLRNLNTVPVLLGCALLSAFDIRYLTGIVLLSPVLLLHLLAVRPEHGYFTLYFALPWLLPCAIWLGLFLRRSRTSQARFAEGVVILIAALMLSAPIQAVVGAPGEYWSVARWTFQSPVLDIPSMQAFVLRARDGVTATGETRREAPNRACVSVGIAALIPGDIHPDEVVTPGSDLRECHVLFLMRDDMSYAALTTRAAAGGFARTNAKYKAEMWLPTK
jgi:hypothetical protein